MKRDYNFEGWNERLLQSDSSISMATPEALIAHQWHLDLEGLGLVGLTLSPNVGPHVQGPSIPDYAASADRLVQDFQDPRPHARIIFYFLSSYFLELRHLRLLPLQLWLCRRPEPLPLPPPHEQAMIPIWPRRSWWRHEPPSTLEHPRS